MKKYLLIAAAACVALAACTKNEVKPLEVDQEITFQTISTKVHSAYATSNTFRSWAYLHTDAYATGITNQLYIGGNDGLVISYVGTEWKNADNKYYWPKNGDKLSFYSYALNSVANTLTTGTVSCSFEEGIKVVGYDIEDNLNVDFLVADVAKDQVANSNTYGHNGVPTLFRHRLSNVAFKIKTAEDYANKTFTFKSITLKGVTKTADYIQAPFATEAWNGHSTANIVFSNTENTFTSSELTPVANQSYYIPQTFLADQKVELVYTITTENGTATPAVETITVEKQLNALFPNSWEMGKKYLCIITVSLEEILWDPAVEEWDPGISNSLAI
ncbi:MAG: fimbrillin family protein [Candidatus Cryptobacteroides sp.]